MQKLKDWFQKLFKKADGKGFTLIEIVIVLAIAGLIFVIVFVAVSAAQASRRDTARRNDASRLLAAVNQYAANNAGQIPNTQALLTNVLNQYLIAGGSVFQDPATGANYTLTYGAPPATPANFTIYYQAGFVCQQPGFTHVAGNARQFAITVYQERGLGACIDNR